MKRIKKIIISTIIVNLILSFIIIIPKAYASYHDTGGTTSLSLVDGLGDLDKYKGDNIGSQKLENKANIILGTIKILGIVASVAMLIVIGIKYMLGSVEEKAEYKKTLVPYLVGAFLLFTGSLVPQLIYQFMQGL